MNPLKFVKDFYDWLKRLRFPESDSPAWIIRDNDNPLVRQSINPIFEIGRLQANAIRAGTVGQLHKQSAYKSENLG